MVTKKVNDKFFERAAYAIRFMRLKRGLSQEELAKKAFLSQSALTALENLSQKVSLGTVEHFLYALGININFINDPGLYAIYPDCHKFHSSFVICAIMDAYCYSLPDEIILKLGYSGDFITSVQLKDILTKLNENEIIHIFKMPPSVTAFIVARPEILRTKEFYINLIKEYVGDNDPFLKLLTLLNIDFIDCYKLVQELMKKVSLLRTAPLQKLYSLSPDLQKLQISLDNILLKLVK